MAGTSFGHTAPGQRASGGRGLILASPLHAVLFLGAANMVLGSMPRSVPMRSTQLDGNNVAISLRPQRSGLTQNWLQQWLDQLVVEIPNIDKVKDSFKIGISNGKCSHFKLAGIETTQDGNQVRIKASGLSASCALGWSVENVYIKSLSGSGDVNASVGNGQLGGPISFGESGDPALPTSIVADKCQCDIQVTDLHFSGSMISAILEVLSPVIKAALAPILGKVVCTELTAATDGPATKALQNASVAIRHWLAAKSNTSSTPPSLPEPRQDFADLGNNSGVVTLQKLFGVLGNSSSNFSINKLMESLLGPNGSITLKNGFVLPIKKTVNLASIGVINITIEQLTLAGLNTWSRLNLDSLGPQQLAVAVGIGALGVDIRLKLEVEPTPTSPIKGGKLEEDFALSLKLKNISTGTAFFAALNTTYLSTLVLAQLASVGCLSPGLYSALETNASLSLPSLGASLAPYGVSLDALDKAIDNMIDSVMGVALAQFTPALSAVASHGVGVTLKDKVNDGIQKTLAHPPLCSAPPPTYANPGAEVVGYWLGLFFLIVAILMGAVICPLYAQIQRRRKQKRELPLLSAGMGALEAGNLDQTAGGSSPQDVAAAESHGNDTTLQGHDSLQTHTSSARKVLPWDCLAFHPRTKPLFRWGLPLLDVAVVCLCVASNCSIATSVNVSIEADSRPIVQLPPVFGFSLISSVKDMWDGKVYPLALLIVVFSGIWPYTKLAVMQLCWFAPPKMLSPGRRMWLLEFLDNWGKWSLVDGFVMVLFMVAFKFNLDANNEDVYPPLAALFKEAGATAEVNVYVEANIGFHIFLIATLGSLVVGHLMTACNRHALQLGEYSPSAIAEEIGERRRLCNTLRPPGFWPGKLFAYGPIIAMSISLGLVCVGIFIDVFAFTFEGLGGYVLNPDDRVRSFSVVSLGLAIPTASRDPTSFGIIWLQCVFLLFSAFSVVTYFAILIVLWCAPLSTKLQTHFFVAAQTLGAWSGVDVFVVSILASVMEISQFVGFIIGDKCDGINKFLEHASLDLPGKQTCFSIATELRSGFAILLVAALISAVMGRLMIARCKSALGMDIQHVDSFVSATAMET